MYAQQAHHSGSEAFRLDNGLGYLLRFGALLLATLALLGALAGAGYLSNPTFFAPMQEQPLLIPTPEPGPRPA